MRYLNARILYSDWKAAGPPMVCDELYDEASYV